MKDKIEFTEFLEIEKKLEIQVGTVRLVEEVPKSEKLLKMTVFFSENDIRTVVTNIKPLLAASWSEPRALENHSFLFVTNLKPVKMMGIESTAMILPGELEKSRGVTVNGQDGTIVL